ncbi:Sterile alpha motif (SAM) domain-containing protein [Euphorbia peplus]|nr:Sterile alpha motif (SAM) domain-containing protein [Euphorbia peplus]
MSGSEVTITLGRSGQVVKKGGKRSRGEGHATKGSFSAIKRNRRDGVKWNPSLNRVNGSKIDKNDLRLKLMRRRLSKNVQNIDERGTKDLNKKPLRITNSHLPQGPEANASNFSRKIMRQETADELQTIESSDKFYSYQVFSGPRARSPNQSLKGYGWVSPPRNFVETWKVPPMRTADVYRGRQFFSDEIIDASRLPGSPHVIMKTTSQAGYPVTRVAPRSGIMHPESHMGEESQTVAGFLHSLGLGKYVVSFQAEEVDMTILKQMGDEDLKEMGIPMGPRKKIILALVARLKRQAS